VTYTLRVLDRELDELIPGLAAIAIEGAKGVGKTETAQRRAGETFRLDVPEILEVVQADPSVIGAARRPVLVDEWQRHPPVWDYVRREVDAGAPAGSFLLAGSAVPKDAPVHSGAGRIVSLRMRPLSLAERQLVVPTVSLADLLDGTRPAVQGTSPVAVVDYVREILASGLPGIRPLPGRARKLQLDGYLSRVIDRDFPEQSLAVRRPQELRRWLTAYAAATSGTATYETIGRAAAAGDASIQARNTIIGYRDVLERLYLLEQLPGWAPTRNHFGKIGTSPKHHLADPALAARLLGVDAQALMRGEDAGPSLPRDGTLLGALFESLITLSVRVYAQAADAHVRHFRTRDGRHEADLIIERDDQRIIAVEVKLAASPGADSVKHLLWLQDQLGDELLDAVVITTGQRAYRRDDGIAVIPAALLGP